MAGSGSAVLAEPPGRCCRRRYVLDAMVAAAASAAVEYFVVCPYQRFALRLSGVKQRHASSSTRPVPVISATGPDLFPMPPPDSCEAADSCKSCAKPYCCARLSIQFEVLDGAPLHSIQSHISF